jgi:hypothetical protein
MSEKTGFYGLSARSRSLLRGRVRRNRACQSHRLDDPLQHFAPPALMEVLPALAKALPTPSGHRCRPEP